MNKDSATMTSEEFEQANAEKIEKEKSKQMISMVARQKAENELKEQARYQEELYIKPKRELSTYDVKGVNFKNKKDTQRAINEMRTYQDSYCLYYGDLANQEINYKTLGDDDKTKQAELARRLKSYNDAYTVSMLSSCYAPLAQGVDIGTLIQVSFNVKSLEMMNPSFNMDKSRFYDNLRKELIPMVDSNPLLKPLKPAMEKLNEGLQSDSAKLMNESISNSLKENDFDSLVMTPRQIAVLKVNFMEQYYVDMRSQDPKSATYKEDMAKLKQNYETSVQHLQAVAENSGFDMSVVAAEERYFVGLKMQANPDAHYENVFTETYSIYGASRSVQQTHGNFQWDGKFMSADEHDFNAQIGDYNGSFTVREPIVTEEQRTNFTEGLKRQGQQYAWMIEYLNSDTCPCSKDVKETVIKDLTSVYDDYKERAARVAMDDWGYSEKDAAKFIENTFTAGANMEFELAKEIPFDEVTNPFATDVGIATGKDFYNELKYTVEKQAFESIGININAKKNVEVNGETVQVTARDEKIDELAKKAKLYYENLGSSDERSNEQIADDLVNNWIESLNAYEVERLMLHVGANMEQGITSHGSFSRDNRPTVTDEYSNFLDQKEGDRVSSVGGTDLTNRELPDYNDEPDNSSGYYDDI